MDRTKVRRLVRDWGVLVAALVLCYAFVIRPWHIRWGATDEEVEGEMPGDHLLPEAGMVTTRAITIAASAGDIWPWLVQMGQGRGGLYSYDWLENIAGCDIHSADSIISPLQSLRIGDTIRLGPEGYPYNLVSAIDTGRSLLLVGGFDIRSGSALRNADGAAFATTWLFHLHPLDERHTRLIVRFRADWEDVLTTTFGIRGGLEPAHFVMERKMLLGICERVTSQ